MSNLTRFFVSALCGFGLAGALLLVSAIFGPLLFPLSLSDAESEQSSNALVSGMMLLAVVFATVGFAVCWKLTKRAVKE